MKRQKNKSIISFNEFKTGELEAVKILIHKSIKECYLYLYSREVIAHFIHQYNRNSILKHAENGYTVTAKENNKIIGTANITGNEINSVFLSKKYEKAWIRALIIEHMLDVAKKKNIKNITINSSSETKKIYANMGFQMVKRDFQIIDSHKFDFLLMEKEV